MGRVEGKVALITGGASGIGRACAQRLAEEGAVVCITDLNQAEGEQTLQAITEAGGAAWFQRHDVASEADWGSVVAQVRARFGRLDILVNNAGVAARGRIVETDLVDWRRQMAVNVDGVFLGAKHALPLMYEGGAGSIINMSSIAAMKPGGTTACYAATKAAVAAITKALALECSQAGFAVRVNSLHPGIIDTPMWAGAEPDGSDAPNLDGLAAQLVPLGCKGLPKDIADAVLWLASNESRYVNGAAIVIDGGLLLK